MLVYEAESEAYDNLVGIFLFTIPIVHSRHVTAAESAAAIIYVIRSVCPGQPSEKLLGD